MNSSFRGYHLPLTRCLAFQEMRELLVWNGLSLGAWGLGGVDWPNQGFVGLCVPQLCVLLWSRVTPWARGGLGDRGVSLEGRPLCCCGGWPGFGRGPGGFNRGGPPRAVGLKRGGVYNRLSPSFFVPRGGFKKVGSNTGGIFDPPWNPIKGGYNSSHNGYLLGRNRFASVKQRWRLLIPLSPPPLRV